MRDVLASFDFLTPKDIDYLESKMTYKKMKKGDFFIQEGSISMEVGFVVSGIFRSFYYSSNEEEVTYCFTFKDSFVSAYSSFLSQSPTVENIQALTDIELLTVSKDTITELESSNINWLKTFK